MKRSGFLFALLLVCAGAIYGSTCAQTITAAHFNCIVYNATTCPAALEHYSGAATLAIVAGYTTPADSGGGEYVLGPNCPDDTSGPPTGNFKVGDNTIRMVSGITASIVVGSIVNASGYVPAGTEIAALPGSGNIVMTEPAIATGTTQSFTITGPNGGTLIRANGALCFYKTNYRGDPHEFGAVGDGSTPDTTAIQSWLGAYGMVAKPAATAAPANFGPWIATIPANYLVYAPLVCPPNANIQAPANLTAKLGGSSAGSPSVQITAAPLPVSGGLPAFEGLLGQSALMVASDYCRLSGIALNATTIGNYYQAGLSGTYSTSGGVTTVSFGTVPPGTAVGMPISALSLPSGTEVASVNFTANTLTISPAITGSGSDTYTITGFDTVDVQGTHVSIDSRSLLIGGYDNVHCGNPLQFTDGLQVKDVEIIQGTDEGIHLGGCTNIRLIGDLISGSGTGGTGFSGPLGAGIPPDGNGVSFGGQELTVASGVIEQSGGVGLNLSSAQLVSVSDMYFDNNGKLINGAAIEINGDNYVTICGNHIHRSGGYVPGTITSQVYFAGTSDNIDLCGDVYYPDDNPNDATLKPSYVYDAAGPISGVPQTVLTNSHFYEQPSPQAAGAVYSPNAAPLLATLQVPQFTNEITGLTLSNLSGVPSLSVNIAAGSAVDSTGTALIQLPPITSGSPTACVVNLGGTHGAGGLDTGTASGSTTYNFFAIASAGGSNGGTPSTSCVASLAMVPSFSAASLAAYTTTLKANFVPGSNLLYVPSVAGIKVGDAVEYQAGFITVVTTVANIGTNTLYAESSSFTSTTTFTVASSIASQLVLGMNVSDNSNNATANSSSTSGGCFGSTPGQNYFTSYSQITAISGTTVTVSPGATAGSVGNPDCITISGGNTITISPATSGSGGPTQKYLTFDTGVYRMLGALNTDATPNIVPFTQDGDTFYLNTPVNDVAATLGSGVSTPILLPSVPSGISVEAMGRCVGVSATAGNLIFVYSPPISPGTPSAFSSAPGFAVQTIASGNALTAYPYRLYTDTSTHIAAEANAISALQCETDGWVWHRAQ